MTINFWNTCCRLPVASFLWPQFQKLPKRFHPEISPSKEKRFDFKFSKAGGTFSATWTHGGVIIITSWLHGGTRLHQRQLTLYLEPQKTTIYKCLFQWDDEPNLYIENGCFTKHQFINGWPWGSRQLYTEVMSPILIGKKRNQKPKDWNSKIKNQVISKWFPKKKQKMEKAPKSMVSRWCFSIFSFLGRRIQYTMTSQPTNQPTPNILVAKTTGLLIRFFLERKLTWSQQNYIICC